MKKVKFLCVFVLAVVIICASCQKGEEKETIKIAGIKEQIDELDIEEAEMQEAEKIIEKEEALREAEQAVLEIRQETSAKDEGGEEV